MISHDNEKVTFGVTIDNSVEETQHLSPKNVFDTPNNLTPVATRTSPFYTVNSAVPSSQSIASMKSPITVYETDLEACRSTPLASTSRLDLAETRTKECTMWPTKQTLRANAFAEKTKRRQSRGCGCGALSTKWSTLDKRQRLWIKSIIALFIIALAVGLGVGISRAVGGGVWASNGQQKSIPTTHD